MTDWTTIAAAVLAEVGLTFDDVYDLGDPWPTPAFLRGPADKPIYAGICHPLAYDNPTARKRHLIGLTGPVDCEKMLAILAHECGHIKQGWSSIPDYIQEWHSELYAFDVIRRHLGKEPSPEIVEDGKAYVRKHCEGRYIVMGPRPHKQWRRDVVEWCGFEPPEPLEFVE